MYLKVACKSSAKADNARQKLHKSLRKVYLCENTSSSKRFLLPASDDARSCGGESVSARSISFR